MDHPPDGFRPVVRNHQRTVGSHCYTHWPPPHTAFRSNEAGDELLIFSARFSIGQRYSNHLISGTLGFVPRSMLGGENVAFILLGELSPFVKSELKRGVMRLQQHVR